MKIWKQTKTLDGLIDDLEIAKTKEGADVVLTGGKTVVLDEYPHLKGIFRCGVTRTGLPYQEAAKRSVKIGFPSDKTANYIYEETADFTCYLILWMLYGKVGTIDPWVKYSRTALVNKNLLVLGMGKIGSKVYDKMQKFMKVDHFDIRKHSSVDLPEKISIADCITLHIPSTDENREFFNKERLKLMKDNAVLVNTARGLIVSEDALYEEIKNSRLRAAFDVYWKEPYLGKLKQFHPDKFFMTPHTASTSNEFLKGTANDFREFLKTL